MFILNLFLLFLHYLKNQKTRLRGVVIHVFIRSLLHVFITSMNRKTQNIREVKTFCIIILEIINAVMLWYPDFSGWIKTTHVVSRTPALSQHYRKLHLISKNKFSKKLIIGWQYHGFFQISALPYPHS